MEYQQLGSTELRVSRIALGTVELGMDYGFRGSPHYQRPDLQEAISIVHRALDLGITLIDTARGYGTSEEVIGKALKGRREKFVLASKVAVSAEAAESPKPLREAIMSSIEASLSALQLETIDLMQIHVLTHPVLRRDEVWSTLEDARRAGKIRFIGASCYGEEVPLAALGNDHIKTLQVPFNALDRRMMPRVFPGAAKRGIGILVRSAFLRGVLTNQVDSIPARLAPVRDAALKICAGAGQTAQNLSAMALRFCLSFKEVGSVIIGVRSIKELDSNVADAEKGALPETQVAQFCQVSVPDERLLDPQNWQDLI